MSKIIKNVPFIGGDTHSFNYDFGLKVANSVVECPMRIFQNPIDLNNIPSPVGYPKVTTDFAGKVAGSTTVNGNIAKYTRSNAIVSPSGFTTEFDQNGDNSTYYGYNGIMTNGDNKTQSVGIGVAGQIPQELFSFNLIRAFEDNFGTIPNTTDTASKVAWLKNNIKSYVLTWYGYGVNNGANKAYLKSFNAATNLYYSGYSHTNSASSLLTDTVTTSASITNAIDSNGFIYYLACTDAVTSGTNTIYTDYIKLEITWKDQSTVVWWNEITDQSTLDKIKSQDNTSFTKSTNVGGKAQALLVECDMTAVASVLGGTSALKSALKLINADAWMMGTGANSGALVYSSAMRFWSAETYNSWSGAIKTNTTSSIAKTSDSRNDQGNSTILITSQNKIYLLIYSQYPSDGSTPSQVSLDFLSIKVDISRTPDSIGNPPKINLPNTWSLLIRGFVPLWDNTLAKERDLINIYLDSNNYYCLNWSSLKKITLAKKIGGNFGTPLSGSPVPVFIKFQAINFLIMQKSNGMYLYILANNGELIKNVNTDVRQLVGDNFSFYIGQWVTSGYEMDGMIEQLFYMPNVLFNDDNQILRILNGTEQGYENAELFNINNVLLNANATISGNTITLNATANYQGSTISINVLPNNRYELKGTVIGGDKARVLIMYYYNNVFLGYGSNINSLVNTVNVTIPYNCNQITLKIENAENTIGTFLFKNISFKRKD